jgi:hypothetical protein
VVWFCSPVNNVANVATVECVVCGSHFDWAFVVLQVVQYVSALIMTMVVLRQAEEHCVSRDRTVRVCVSGLDHALDQHCVAFLQCGG